MKLSKYFEQKAKNLQSMVDESIAMRKEPASKEWFKKHGMPKAITNHPLKKKMAEKMKKGKGTK